jgi:hypothetical protein
MANDVKDRVAALGLPPGVGAGLAACVEELVDAGGPAVRGILLYGSAARGRYRAGESDLNVVLVLADAAPDTLDKIAGPLRRGRRAVALEPFLVTGDEVPRAADVFPTKFADISAHHVLLHGEDVFAQLEVPRAHLRLRVEQELRNLCLRLRRAYVGVQEDPQRLAAVLVDLVPGASVELGALLRLLGHATPADDSPAAVFAAAAPVLGVSSEGLSAAARPTPAQSVTVAHLLLEALSRAADLADEAG